MNEFADIPAWARQRLGEKGAVMSYINKFKPIHKRLLGYFGYTLLEAQRLPEEEQPKLMVVGQDWGCINQEDKCFENIREIASNPETET